MTEPLISIKEIIAKVKHLEIRARKLVQDTISSDYHSVFRGRGIEFNEVRNYFPGDDVRDIDWNVTARMHEAFVKTYIEERQLTIFFAVDVSGSNSFGSMKSKREMMAEVAAMLGFASFFNNDRAGLILFSADIEKVIPPRKNYSHLLRIIRDTWYYEAENKKTSITKTLLSIYNLLKKKSILVILSDFLDSGYEKALLALSHRHEVIPIVVNDSMEENLPHSLNPNGSKWKLPILADVEDMETGQTKTINLNRQSESGLERYRSYYRHIFRKLGLDFAEISPETDYYKTVELLLRRRMKKQ